MTDHAVLITQARIQERVAELAARIDEDFAGRELDLVYAVNGASMFCADLARSIKVPVRLHPLGFSPYPKAGLVGEIRLTLDVGEPLNGRHVLFVEGIIVSGRTPGYIVDMLRLRKPASLGVCALGVKRRLLTTDLPLVYAAFDFDREIVVGYGVGNGPEKAIPFLVAN